MTAKDWFAKAQNEHFAIGAFNAANIETVKAIIAAAIKLRSPVIIEASHGEVEYIGGNNLVSIVKNARAETGLPIFTNLDHAPTDTDAMRGIAWGFDLIHFNCSQLPFEEAVEKTKKVVAEARQHDILVEAELDAIAGSSTIHLGHTTSEQLVSSSLTNPDKAAVFVKETGIDTLAVSIGNIHGLYDTVKHLDLPLLQKIKDNTQCFYSLHGGSGIPAEEIRSAIRLGVVKVNINTELRLAFRQSLEQSLQQTDEVAIYKIMPPVIAAVQKIVEEKMIIFNSQNQVRL